MARQIGKMLNAREPKIVNGPEILNKYVGASEENIRKLFADAEKEVSLAVTTLIPSTDQAPLSSTRPRAMRVACISSSSMSWMLSANSVVQLIVGLELVTASSTSFCRR